MSCSRIPCTNIRSAESTFLILLIFTRESTYRVLLAENRIIIGAEIEIGGSSYE